MISIEKSIKTCKVNTDMANRLQSDRFLNPQKALCYTWTGLDSVGREVGADTFYQKNQGCNLTQDRLLVENELRPKYYNYVNLDARGLQHPNTPGGNFGYDLAKDTRCSTRYIDI